MPSLVVQKFYVLLCSFLLPFALWSWDPPRTTKRLKKITKYLKWLSAQVSVSPPKLLKFPPTITPLIWDPVGHLKGQRALEKHSSEHFTGTPSQEAKTTPQSTFRPGAPGPWKSAPKLQTFDSKSSFLSHFDSRRFPGSLNLCAVCSLLRDKIARFCALLALMRSCANFCIWPHLQGAC